MLSCCLPHHHCSSQSHLSMFHPKFDIFPLNFSTLCIIGHVISRSNDSYHEHEPTANLCGRYFSHPFACPVVPSDHIIAYTLRPSPLSQSAHPYCFTAFCLPQHPLSLSTAFHCTCLHPSISFTTLYQCLKAWFPAAKGPSGYCSGSISALQTRKV